MIGTVLSDFSGLRRVCGPGVALRWLAMIALHLPQCVRTRRLHAADLAMGPGPFAARRPGGAVAKLPGRWAIAAVREIWVRDVYLGGDHVRLPPGALVLDLGANRGVFTALALASHPDVRVVAVEPRAEDCDRIREMLRINGWEGRAQVCNAFLGGKTEAQEDMIAAEPGGVGEFLSEAEFIGRYGLSKIDLIKCDIEGSEFDLLHAESRLLAMTNQVTMEVHAAGERRQRFRDMLESLGFDVVVRLENPVDCIINARRRR
jgi:hypothetical protein